MVASQFKSVESCSPKRRRQYAFPSSVMIVLDIVLVLILCFGTSFAESGDNTVNTQPRTAQQPPDEMAPRSTTPARTGSVALGRAPAGISPGLQIGSTLYEYQKNGSMNRQIGTRGDGHVVYFTWMAMPPGGATRTVQYNAFDPSSGLIQLVGGGEVSPSWSGYVTMDMVSDGSPVIANHRSGTWTEPWVYYETFPGSGSFDDSQMPHSVWNWFLTGSANVFIWPKVAITDNGGTPVTHVIIADDGDGSGDGSGKTLYVRKEGAGATGAWGFPVQIDAGVGYNLSSVIVASREPASQKVAIIWAGGRGDGTSGGPPIPREDGTAAGQRDNDLYVWISTDAGTTWDPANRRNLTMRPDDSPVGYYPAAKLSALWDSNEDLHVVWLEGQWAGYSGTFDFRARLQHWDEVSDVIVTAHDADWDPTVCNAGVFNLNVSNPQLSECDGKLYLTYSQFNEGPSGVMDDCSDDVIGGGANADIALIVSPDGGLSWDAPRNLTQTYTPGCVEGDCASEAWHSTTRYGIDISGEDFSLIPDVSANVGEYAGNNYLFTQFIEDLDAGGFIQGEGTQTDNPVKTFMFGCVEPNFPFFTRGDVNGDGVADEADATAITDFLFSGTPFPAPPAAADVDDDGDIDLDDAAYLLAFVAGGDAPPPPYPGCGQDPTLPQAVGASICNPGDNTYPGYDVVVDLGGGVVITFPEVLQSGTSSAELSYSTCGHAAPGSYQVLPLSTPICFDITTTADYVGPVLVCIVYDPADLGGAAESDIEMGHYDDLGGWEVLATTVDEVNNIACAEVTSLSPFILMVPESGGCCIGTMRGNIDNDPGDEINIADLVYMVDYMFNDGPAPLCWDEAELEAPFGDEALAIQDLVFLVDYMFNEGPPPGSCP